MKFKIDKNKNYTVMGNYHLRDKNLSLKAKGLLSFMLSLPDDWDYSIQGLVAISKESRDTIKSTLNELKEYNYLKIEKHRNKKGLYEYTYLIYEKAVNIIKKVKENDPEVENPGVDKPEVDNYLQINTNNKVLNTKDDKLDKKESSFFNENNHEKLTINLIKKKYINEYDNKIYLFDELFNELLYSGYHEKELFQISNYIIDKVKERNFTDEYGEKIKNKYGYFKESMLSNIKKLNNDIDLVCR